VIGLSVGFASFFALWQYATAELKVDQYHTDYDRIGRLGMNWDWTEDDGKTWGHMTFSLTKPSLPPRFQEDYPEVESTLRTLGQPGFFQLDLVPHRERIMIAVDRGDGHEQIFKETGIKYADENFFDFFTIPLVYGHKDKVLSEANSAVLSKSTAIKYFGSQNPIGKLIRLNDSTALKVTGVFQDFPHNTHLGSNIVLSNQALLTRWSSAWLGFTHNYVKLKPGASFQKFEAKLKADTEKYLGENLKAMKGTKLDMFVQPLKDVAYSKNFTGDDFPVRSKTILMALATLSVVVLVMAWANYINLSVSRTTKRMKEFATRKAIGAVAIDLIKQLLIESALINFLALALALTFLQIVRQPLIEFFNIHTENLWITNISTWLFFASIIIGGILLTGIYPALLCLGQNPRVLLMKRGEKRIVPVALTTIQFTAAIALITWGFTVFLQLDYILTKDTGLNKNQVVVVESPIIKSNHYQHDVEDLIHQLGGYSSIGKVAGCWKIPGDLNPGGSARRIGGDFSFGFDCNGVDENFIPLFEVRLLAGRNFIRDERKDVIVVSQVAVERLGFKKAEDAVGARVEVQIGDMKDWREVEIIGIINDYRLDPFLNFNESNSNLANGGKGNGILLSYKTTITGRYTTEKIALKMSTREIDQALPEIETLFKKTFPGNAFSSYVLDEHINRFYGGEKFARNQLILFSILTIGIACLGLLGMIANKVIEKTKEIGVRKVLGAGSIHIGIILINTTIRQFVLSVLFGVPLAWYLSQQYLERYSEQVTLQWWHYALPVIILLMIMFLSIVSLLFKAAKTNPVESLRYE
jgi:putative ABC transport system permease protein